MPEAPISRTRKPAGRPRHYDAQHLMDAWLYVETLKAKTGLSARQVCLKSDFHWAVGGRLQDPPENRKTGRPVIKHSASKETLRRRYQEAVRFLKSEAESHNFGRQGPAEMSPTESWWRRELEMRLAYFNKPKKSG